MGDAIFLPRPGPAALAHHQPKDQAGPVSAVPAVVESVRGSGALVFVESL